MHIFVASILQYSVVGIIIVGLSCYYRNTKLLQMGVLLYAAFLVGINLLFLPRSTFFLSMHWNWQGKILELLFPLVIVYALKWLTPDEVGLRAPRLKRWYLYVIIIAVIYDLIMLAISDLSDSLPQSDIVNWQTILYQLTMPGLAEEIFFRGLLWGIINRYIKNKISIFRLHIGWDFILTSILFVMVHWITLNSSTGQVTWAFWDNCTVLLTTIMLAATRVKTRSIWPCVIFHNALNGLFFIMVYFLVY